MRIFFSVFVIMAGWFLLGAVKTFLLARSSESWPTVQGKIISSTVDSIHSHRGISYWADVLYEYSVDGMKQSSHNVAFDEYSSNEPSHARETVNRYPPGTYVTVHYSPAAHNESVLEAGIRVQTFFFPGICVVLLIFGILMFFFCPPRIFQRQQSSRNNTTINFSGS